MLNLYFLHTVGRNSDMFRTNLLIRMDLLIVSKRYTTNVFDDQVR
jgi:hypothetical protein